MGDMVQRRGIAIVSVLMVSLLVLLLIAGTTNLVLRDTRLAKNSELSIQLAELADGFTERARVKTLLGIAIMGVDTSVALDMLMPCRIGSPAPTTPCVPVMVISPETPEVGLRFASASPASVKWKALYAATLPTAANVKTALITKEPVIINVTTSNSAGQTTMQQAKVEWRYTLVSPQSATLAWVEITATARAESQNNPEAQAVVKKIQMSPGTARIFFNAMAADKLDCVFCHTSVDGDVGVNTNTPFAPGQHSSGLNYKNKTNLGAGSRITGTVFAKGNIASEVSNGAVYGSTAPNYSGDRIIQDTNNDGRTDFPRVDIGTIASSPSGTLSDAMTIKVYNNSSTFQTRSEITQVVNSQLIVQDGIISGDIAVTGDVVISGIFSGRGAIYSGRNIYIVGDIEYINPPDQPGSVGGVCANITDKDQCAIANIIAQKDELRLAAAGNIIIGKFREVSAETYLKDQFGFKNPSVTQKYTNNATTQNSGKDSAISYSGEELWYNPNDTVSAADDKWYNSAGIKESTRTPLSSESAFAALFDPLWFNGITGVPNPWITIPEYNAMVSPITEINAFLYANNRVAGATSGSLTINGGVIAREIGILSKACGHSDNTGTTTPCAADQYALNINYDYRMRQNSGYGYNPLKGNTPGSLGNVLDWRLDEKGDKKF